MKNVDVKILLLQTFLQLLLIRYSAVKVQPFVDYFVDDREYVESENSVARVGVSVEYLSLVLLEQY